MNTRFSRRAVLAAAGTLAATAAMAQRWRQSPATYELLRIGSPTHDLRRIPVAIDDERHYQLFIAAPKPAPGSGGHPIMYCLDGNSVFNRLTADHLARVPGLIVAGIGYPTEMPIDSQARSRDYTPMPRPGHDRSGERGRGRPIGGAPAFLDLMTGRLRQEAEAGLTVDPSRRTIWGHSYGGLFCLYALFTAPDAFRRYIPVSPSTGWGGGVMLDLARDAPHREAGPADVLVMLGDSEGRTPDGTPIAGRPSISTVTMIDRLKARPDLHVASHIFEGLTHGATFAASFPAALELAASK